MYGVMIVDDEFNIRAGLKKIIDWEEYGLEIVAEASNGKEALEIFDENKIKIIVTDIKMPVMDGIELIKEISNRKQNTRIIVLSGYDDFDYVRNSMRHGAENYLLKPLSRDELLTTVREIVEDIEKNLFFETYKSEGLSYLRNSTLNRLIKNEISLKELKEKTELLSLDIWQLEMWVAIIQPYWCKNQDDGSSICEIVRQSSKNHYECITFLDTLGNTVIIFFNCKDVKTQLEYILKNVLSEFDLHVSVAVGNLAPSHRSLHQAYRQAMQALDHTIAFGFDKIIFFEDIACEFENRNDNVPEYSKSLSHSLDTKNKDYLINIIHSVFVSVKEGQTIFRPEAIRNIATKMIIQIIQVARNSVSDSNATTIFNEFEVLQQVIKANSIDALESVVINIGSDAIKYLEDSHSKKYSKLVDDVIKIIEQNYFDPNISIKTIANLKDVSAVHIGRVFKNETGQFFSDYLNEVRIRKAKELLTSSSIKARNIAEQVGFTSASYFVTVFKKLTGLNTSDFR